MKLLKKFISYYKPHRKLFIIDMFCALLLAVADLVYPIFAKNIINEYVPQRALGKVFVCIAILLGIYLLKGLFNYVVSYWGHLVGVGIQADMRRDMFEHLQKLPFSFYDEHKTGAIMSRISNDLMDISELAHHCPEDLFLSLIMLGGSFAILSTINIWLTLIVFAVIPFIILFAAKMRGNMHTAFKASREKTAVINAGVEASVSGIRVSRSYTAEDFEKKKFADSNSQFVSARRMAYKQMSIFHCGMNLLTDILYLVVLVSGALFFYYGKIDIGGFAAFLLYVNVFLNPVRRLINFFEQYQDGMTGLARFDEIMNTACEKDEDGAKELDSCEGKISFSHVTFSYKTQDGECESERVINDLSFDIFPGKTVALVGPSGGGKTTLCHLIPRFYEIDGGEITIDGENIKNLTRRSLRRNIGIVQQNVFLFNGTIRENIEYGKPGASTEEIIEAAKKARIDEFVTSLPDGYETNVGERGIKLSGGQMQRVSIARVFLKNPSVLILDEATSALDNVTEEQIQQSFDELSRGRTSIVVAHRLSTVKNADEIVVLTDGGIAERGSHSELLAAGGIYSELYSLSN